MHHPAAIAMNEPARNIARLVYRHGLVERRKPWRAWMAPLRCRGVGRRHLSVAAPQRCGAPALRRPSVPPASNIETVGTRSSRYAMSNQRARCPLALSGQWPGLTRRRRAAIALRRHAKLSCAGERTLGRRRIRPAPRGADWPMPRFFAQRRAAPRSHHGRSATSPVLVATCPPRLPAHDLSAAVVDHPALDGADATLRARPRPMGPTSVGAVIDQNPPVHLRPAPVPVLARPPGSPGPAAHLPRASSSTPSPGSTASTRRFAHGVTERTPRAIAKVRHRLRARQPGSKTIRDRPVDFL